MKDNKLKQKSEQCSKTISELLNNGYTMTLMFDCKEQSFLEQLFNILKYPFIKLYYKFSKDKEIVNNVIRLELTCSDNVITMFKHECY